MSETPTNTNSRPKSIIVRRANLADAAAITTLGGDVFSLTFGHSVPPHELQAYLDSAYTIELITNDLQDPMKDVVVATNKDQEILGFAYLTRGTTEPCVTELDRKVELQRIYVYPATHGKGIGGLLARSVEKLAQEQGFEYIWLGVWEENHNAQRAYEKWGYKRVGEHDFEVGSVVQTDYILVKRL